MESWVLVVGIIGLFMNAAIIFLAVKQLRLSRRESRRHPLLVIQEVTCSDAADYENVRRVVEARKKLQEWDDMSSEEREAYMPPEDSSGQRFEGLAQAGRAFKGRAEYIGSYTLGQVDYEGPIPDLVFSFRLVNRGLRSAHEVEGKVCFPADVLQPIKFPKFKCKVNEGFDLSRAIGKPPHQECVSFEPVIVPPSFAEEVTTFNVPLTRKSSGRVSVKIVFSNPDGDYLEKAVTVEV